MSGGTPDAASASRLDDSDLKVLSQLKARDREVRAHEAAHQSTGGLYAGSASFTYQKGPDGNQYAIGGEVPVDVSPVPGDPQATIDKMMTIRAAALAPAQPSGQDRAVAAKAVQALFKARAELASGEYESVSRLSPGSDNGIDNGNGSTLTVRA